MSSFTEGQPCDGYITELKREGNPQNRLWFVVAGLGLQYLEFMSNL